MKVTRNVNLDSASQIESKSVQNDAKTSQASFNKEIAAPSQQLSVPERNAKLAHLDLEGTTKQFSLKTKLDTDQKSSEPVFKDVKIYADPTLTGPSLAVGPCGAVGPCNVTGPCNNEAVGPCD